MVFGTCDCPIVTVSATSIAIQLHLLAKAVGGVTRDTGGGGIKESDILHTLLFTTIRDRNKYIVISCLPRAVGIVLYTVW